MDKVLMASASPHKKTSLTTRRIMIDVLIALIPTAVMGIIYFGFKAAKVAGLSVITCVVTEVIWQFVCGLTWKEIWKRFDFTSVVTGVLLAMCFNSLTPWYVVMISAAFAIGMVKMLFGGTGKNIVNPAICGRVFALIAFPAAMTAGYVLPAFTPDTVTTGATPLVSILEGNTNLVGIPTVWQMFLGIGMQGIYGETCKLAILVGYAYLVIRKVIDWKWPLITIGMCGLTHVVLNGFNFSLFLPYIFTGGLFIGAIFMATDYVTSPNTQIGNLVYYTVLGAFIAVLRHVTKMEVVSFAILLMNLLVPMIDRFCRPHPFGYTKPEKNKEAAK
ncbi:MAG: RnfABCDGE type electron transport complex subunit D [Clostridia bacterium]|nr:RnfABCDGE type electron transport complex subunit D [Clostridia bacterium]